MPAKLTPLHRQAIDIAARVMWAEKWGEHVSTTCAWCGKPISDAGNCRGRTDVRHVAICSTPPHAHRCAGVSPNVFIKCNCGLGGPLDAIAVAPTTPEYAKLAAALWFGHVERANGCPLPEIVEAARKADEACPDSAPFDTNEFFEVITYEALTGGEGWNWCDGHERFTLPFNGHSSGATCGAVHSTFQTVCVMPPHKPEVSHIGRGIAWRGEFSTAVPFILPPLEFEYDEEEAR